MKVHKTGTPLPDRLPYWVGTRMVCACGCVFELEAGDTVATANERHPGGLATVSAKCPTEGCGLQVTTDLRKRG
jgi:hypothetical protein